MDGLCPSNVYSGVGYGSALDSDVKIKDFDPVGGSWLGRVHTCGFSLVGQEMEMSQ